MTQSRFRTLLILSLILGLSSAFIDSIFPSLIPESFQRAKENQYAAISTPKLLFEFLFALAACIVYIASLFGLYKFRRWAPRAAVIGTALPLVVLPMIDAQTMSGLALSLTYISSYLWGAVLVLIYFSPCSVWFTNQTASSGENNA